MSMNWAGRTVVVTGALGFIGSHFAEQLAALGAHVIGCYRTERLEVLGVLPAAVRTVRVDLRDHAETRAVLRYSAPHVDVVVHCAALDGNARYKSGHAAEILEANTRMTLNVLAAAREHDVGSVVLLSSSEVLAIPEPRRAPNGYVLSKMFAEAGAEAFHEQFGMDIIVARATNVYGPRDDLGGTGRRVIPSMLRQIETDGVIEIWGDGTQTRTFVHVADLVRATLQMVAAHRYRTFAVGSGEQVSIAELGQTLFEVLGRTPRIRLDPAKPAGVPSARADLGPLTEVIDFTPRSLREGLAHLARQHPVH